MRVRAQAAQAAEAAEAHTRAASVHAALTYGPGMP